MDLTNDQQSAVASWIREGKTLADVQRLLREEFAISMTYMDVRFLVDDLDISFAEPEAEEKAGSDEEATAEEAELIDGGGDGSVSVDVDAVVRPGALVSGTVTFSDGKSLGWQLSGSGQLGLVPGDDPGYRPSPEDIEEFQIQLQKVLQQKGF